MSSTARRNVNTSERGVSTVKRKLSSFVVIDDPLQNFKSETNESVPVSLFCKDKDICGNTTTRKIEEIIILNMINDHRTTPCVPVVLLSAKIDKIKVLI
jgi:hypothetical protein